MRKSIGFLGGVAYNKIITKFLKDQLEKKNLALLTDVNIPPGDAGISSGQIYNIGLKLK